MWGGSQETRKSRQTRSGPDADSSGLPTAPSSGVTVLKHCRCSDCRKLSKVGDGYVCAEHIGGTAVVWATGEHLCDPAPDAWHYCAGYDGPQISKDVWVWPRKEEARARRGGTGRRASRNRSAGGEPTSHVRQYIHRPRAGQAGQRVAGQRRPATAQGP